MMNSSFRNLFLPALLALTFLAGLTDLAKAQQGGREQMWFAPTEEDWAKPCLITFQRTWADAVAVSKETGKAILICVNMDGEIASEHYAGVRYRQPKIAKLHEPYVNVVASVYRHNPRDHDEHGNRILCPRFGSVTCGEHIAMEPIVYEKYLDGKRIAPRHIMIELDGSETYDVYHTFDTDSVFKAIGDGIKNRKIKPKNIVRGDRSIVERVASRDIFDREAVEKAYREGDKKLRRSLLEAALALGEDAPLELLRLAVRGFDKEMTEMARRALAQATDADATQIISDALRTPMEVKEREQLIQALKKIGNQSAVARRLAVVHQGMDKKSQAVNVTEWSQAMKGGASYAPAAAREAVTQTLNQQDSVLASENAEAHVTLAKAFLDRAIESMSDGKTSRGIVNSLLEEARTTAAKAEGFGASGWKVNAVLATAAYHLEDRDEARIRAVAAATAGRPEDPESWSAMVVLGLFAEQRRQAIENAVAEKKDWPGEWLTDLHAAYSILAKHPYGDEGQVIAHFDFLDRLGARRQAQEALRAGLLRYPGSTVLHNRLRVNLLKERGVRGLESAYAKMLEGQKEPGDLVWFAGYASTLAAEYHRQRRRAAPATRSYNRAIELYERYIVENPERRDSADQYIAMALGGRARIAFEQGRLKDAVEDLEASFARKPDKANALDGMNLSAVDTAKMVLSKLVEKKERKLSKRLQDALNKLHPDMLKLPAYETADPRGSGPPDRRRRNRGN